MLPFAPEEDADYGFELIYGLPGQGKSVLMNTLVLAHILQGGQDRLPLAAALLAVLWAIRVAGCAVQGLLRACRDQAVRNGIVADAAA